MPIFGEEVTVTANAVDYTFKYLGPQLGVPGSIYKQTGVDSKVALSLKTLIEKGVKRQRTLISLSGAELVGEDYVNTTINTTSASNPLATDTHINKLRDISLALNAKAEADELAKGFY